METKRFSPAVLASISSGILLCDFGTMHEASEWIMGHPIWTHQFPSLRPDLEAAVIAQFPDMPRNVEGVTRENWKEHATALEERFGKTVSVRTRKAHMEIERKRIGDPCPQCGGTLSRLRDAFHWRTWNYDGAYCKPCNALWCIAGEEMPPLRSAEGPKTLGDRP